MSLSLYTALGGRAVRGRHAARGAIAATIPAGSTTSVAGQRRRCQPVRCEQWPGRWGIGWNRNFLSTGVAAGAGHTSDVGDSSHASNVARPSVVNVADKVSGLTETWSPRVIARVNDYDVRVALVEGEFVWHSHDDTDELFYVVEGELEIDLQRGGDTPGAPKTDVGDVPPSEDIGRNGEGASEDPQVDVVRLGPGDLFVVPRGVVHRPRTATPTCRVMLFEPSDVVNTGDADASDFTAERDVWA